MKKIAIFGAGGYGREIACLIKRINSVEPTWNFIGFFDDDETLKGANNKYGKVLGGIELLNKWKTNLSVVIAIGSPNAVKTITERFTNSFLDFPNLIDPTVEFMDRTNFRIGKGNIMCLNCAISCNVEIGDFNLFNVGVGIGHDATIGSYNVIMPNVNISGGVTIGNSNLFGVKSTILQNLKVSNNVKIGASSLIIRNARNDGLYFGIPASRMDQ